MELPIKNAIPSEFLEEEVRCDYYVSTEVKALWAVQIDLLEELKRICAKYNLVYFADSGTLLGAIRHKGYIPWDDDIDIVMKRNDYNKLIQVAEYEFRDPYFLQSAHSEIFPRGYARLRNSKTTALTRYDLGKDINHGIFIDIFPLDNIPDDDRVRKKWIKKIKTINEFLKYGYASTIYERDTKENFIKFIIKYIRAKVVYGVVGYNKLISLYENVCSEYNKSDTKKISYVSYSLGKNKHIWDRDVFSSGHSVKFEFTDIFIPDGYDSRLRTEYRDYMKIVHASTTHGSMIVDVRTPYKEYMKLHAESDLKRYIENNKGEEI